MAKVAELQALGSELRAAREQRDLSLADVERTIKVRAKFLEALERGDAAALPSPVQARGFLRSYARFLQLDGDEYVARWEEALSGGRRRVRRAPQAVSNPRRTSQIAPVYSLPTEPVPHRRLLGVVIVLLMLGSITSAVIIGAGLASSAERNGGMLSAVLSPIPTELPPEPTLTSTPFTPPSPTPLPNPNAAASSESAIQITITARTWLRVTVDDVVVYEGMPGPQTVLQYRGVRFGLRAGNAAGVRVTLNGADLGTLGARGQIVKRVFP
ncbi:MAG: RodZ domain-containing protein [Aggregatilineales bacterium]